MEQGRGLVTLGAVVAGLTVVLATGMGLLTLGTEAPAAVLRSTRLAVLNPNREVARVQVTYAGYAGACAGQVVDHKRGPRDLKPGEIAVFDQGDMMESGLPDDCRAAATIRSEGGPVAAVVLDLGEKLETAAAYLAVGTETGAQRVGVPRWRKREGKSQWVSRIHAMNLGDSPTSARIEFLDAAGRPISGCGGECSHTIAPRSAATWAVDTINALPASKGGGSAMISSDVPLAVVVSELSLDVTVDTAIAGVRALGPPAARAASRHLPLVLRGARLRFAALGGGDAPNDLTGLTGAGTTELAIQNLDEANAATFVADFYKQSGGAPVMITRAAVPPGASVLSDLAAEPALENGAYAAELHSDRQIIATAFTEWPSSGAAVAYDDTPAGAEVLVPLVLKGAEGQTSIITIQNPDTSGQVDVSLALFASGSIQPLVSTRLSVGPGTSTAIDLAKSAAFATVPAGFSGWMRLSAQTPISVMALVDVETSQRAAYAFEGMTSDQLSTTLFAPLVNARWAGDQPPPTATPTVTEAPSATPTATDTASPTRPPSETDTPTASPTRPPRETDTPTPQASPPTPTEGPSPTDVPRATLTPPPGGTATATGVPTRRPPLVAAPGWFRPCGDANAAVEVRMTLGAVGPDGILWLRARHRSGEIRVLRCDPGPKSSRAFNSLRDAVGGEADSIRRNGTLRDFWAVDSRGLMWTNGQVFDGQRWVEIAKDEVRAEGGSRYARLVLLDEDERAWMPVESEAECQRPLGCRLVGARGFGLDGQFGPEVTFEDVPEAGAFGIPDAMFIARKRAGAGPLGAAANTDGGAGDAPAQGSGAQPGWMVTPAGLYLPPEVKPVAYPFLEVPTGARLRNSGYASTAALRPDGRLDVFTWVELQHPSGAEYKIFRNTWNGAAWAVPEDLTNGPLFSGAVKNERITAADYAPDGTLWIGTASGKLGSVKFGVWTNVFLPPVSPLRGRPIQSLSVGPNGTVYISLGELLRDDGTVLPAEVLGFTDEGGFQPARIHLPIARKRN